MAKLTIPERFWPKVNKDGTVPEYRPDLGLCWLWTAGMNNYGYGAFADENRRHRGAHRVAYELLVGPIPDGLTIDHLCRVRRCVNPSHLEVVTTVENLRRGNGWGSRNAAKTHCPQGHALEGDNVYVRPLTALLPNPTRECLACRKDRDKRRFANKV